MTQATIKQKMNQQPQNPSTPKKVDDYLTAAELAEQGKDFFTARHHLANAIIDLQASGGKIDNAWFEKMASWSVALDDPTVGLIYLQQLARNHAGRNLPLSNHVLKHLLQFACGLSKYDLSKKYFQLFISAMPSAEFLLKAELDMLEMMIKLQRWQEAKKLLATVDDKLAKPNITKKIEKSVREHFDYRHDKLASFYYLGMADYAMGFKTYEHRHQKNFEQYFTYRPHHRQTPWWQGEDLKNKTLLVAGEQGFGDVFMFCRFLPLLKKIVGKVILQVHPNAVPLLATSPCCDGIEVIENNATPNKIDAWVLIQSLPLFISRLLGQESLNPFYQRHEPYLAVAGEPRPPLQLPKRKNKKLIGLVWATNIKGHEWQTRTLALKQLLPLLAVHNITLVSLQMGAATKQIAEGGLSPFIMDMSPLIKNFADTAHIIKQLDAVVTVDTAVAHVSGGLMTPTIMLLPKKNDWRWGQDKDSFWYPTSHRLLKQEQDDDWQDVIAAAVKSLPQ